MRASTIRWRSCLSRSRINLGAGDLPRPALPHQALSGAAALDDPQEIVFGELYRLRDRDALLGEFDMYRPAARAFPEPTEYLRQMLQVTLDDGHAGESVDLRLQLARRRPAATSPRGGFSSSELLCRSWRA